MVTLFFFMPACLLILLDLVLATNIAGPWVEGFAAPARHVMEAALIAFFLFGLFFLPAGLGARWIRGRLKRRMPTNPLRFLSMLLILWNGMAFLPLFLVDFRAPGRLIETREAWLLPWMRTTLDGGAR